MFCYILRLFLILVSLSALEGSVAQGQPAGSESDPVASFQLLLRQSKSFYNTNPDSTIAYAKKALDFAVAKKYL